nr:MAG TPA: hypothetical protein [Caudoviricetes sp.]
MRRTGKRLRPLFWFSGVIHWTGSSIWIQWKRYSAIRP